MSLCCRCTLAVQLPYCRHIFESEHSTVKPSLGVFRPPSENIIDVSWICKFWKGKGALQHFLPSIEEMKYGLVLQISAPGMSSELTIPLPCLTGNSSIQPEKHGPRTPATVQVQICADTVCSLQVTFVLLVLCVTRPT